MPHEKRALHRTLCGQLTHPCPALTILTVGKTGRELSDLHKITQAVQGQVHGEDAPYAPSCLGDQGPEIVLWVQAAVYPTLGWGRLWAL